MFAVQMARPGLLANSNGIGRLIVAAVLAQANSGPASPPSWIKGYGRRPTPISAAQAFFAGYSGSGPHPLPSGVQALSWRCRRCRLRPRPAASSDVVFKRGVGDDDGASFAITARGRAARRGQVPMKPFGWRACRCQGSYDLQFVGTSSHCVHAWVCSSWLASAGQGAGRFDVVVSGATCRCVRSGIGAVEQLNVVVAESWVATRLSL